LFRFVCCSGAHKTPKALVHDMKLRVCFDYTLAYQLPNSPCIHGIQQPIPISPK